MLQWESEIRRHVRPGALSVVTYHGNDRDRHDAAALSEADVVLCTYGALETTYRRFLAPPKLVCPYCGKKYKPAREQGERQREDRDPPHLHPSPLSPSPPLIPCSSSVNSDSDSIPPPKIPVF